jgi:hypothetical protein
MAEDIAFNLEVNTGGGAKSLSDLKKEFKELQGELAKTKTGTKEYQLALEKLGQVKDDIGDLRDTINALNPEGKVAAFAKVGSTIASGFAAAQGAAALFGAESEELQKTMLKVQAAMALAEGIKGITAAGDAFRVLNAVMLANPIAAIVVGFGALAATAVVVYNNFFKAASAAEDLTNQLNKVDEANKHINASLKAQITALSGLKGNEEEILALKEKSFKLDIERQKLALQVALAKQAEAEAEFDYIEQSLRFAGKTEEADKMRMVRTKEQRDATRDAIETLKQSIAGLQEFHNTAEQKKLDATVAANKESVANHEKMVADKKAADEKEVNDLFDKLTKEAQIEADIEKFKNDEKKAADEQKLADDQAMMDAYIEMETQGAIQQVKIDKETEEAKRAQKEKTFNDSVNGTKQALQMTQQLTDMFFDYQLKKNKGNAAAELEIRKKQFKVNKAFGVVNAVVDGVGAVQKALNNPYPLNLILAVLSGVLAAANVAKIASAKFDGGDAGGGASDVQPGSMSTGAAPAIPQPNNTVTQINDNGTVENAKPKDQKVFIVETDITDSNKRVANIEETAKI